MPQPTIWMIASYRAGENSQLQCLLEAVATSCSGLGKRIDLTYRPGTGFYNLCQFSGRLGITAPDLAPPWPEIVISAGLRNEPVCRWIQAASGGRTKIVFVGRTWADMKHFDLIITTPQYRLPQRSNILHNELTLCCVEPRTTTVEPDTESGFSGSQHQRIGVLVGGDSGPFALRRQAAQQLARQVAALATKTNASVHVSTSARTDAASATLLHTALQEHLPVTAQTAPSLEFYDFNTSTGSNPYQRILTGCDYLVVTSDSIAMISEAAASAANLLLFDMQRFGDTTIGSLFYKGLMRYAPQRLSRDVSLVHQGLLQSGKAQWLDEYQLDTPVKNEPRAAVNQGNGKSVHPTALSAATQAVLELLG